MSTSDAHTPTSSSSSSVLTGDASSTSPQPSPVRPRRVRAARARLPVLPTVCLVAIVKDEAANPAGGIAAYLERILPAVHSALILDTGSTDGTLQILTEAAQRHPHLHVRSGPFVSFAHARNLSLRLALDMQADHERGRADRARVAQGEREAQAAASPSAATAAALLAAAPLSEELPPFRHFLVLDADEVLAPQTLTTLAHILALDTGVYNGSSSMAAVPARITLAAEIQTAQQQAEAAEATTDAALSTDSATAAAAASSTTPPSVSAPTSPISSPTPLSYPFCLKFSCHCFDATGKAASRSNSGLWNPRVFTADAGFSFMNTVDDFRFERLLFKGRPVDPGCYVREGQLASAMNHLQQYAELRARETSAHLVAPPITQALRDRLQELHSVTRTDAEGEGEGEGDASETKYEPPASSSSSSSSDEECDDGDGEGAAALAPHFTALALQAHAGDDSAAASLTAASRALPLLLPMRHYIPSLGERRRKNAAYKAGGAAAAAAAAAAAQANPAPSPAATEAGVAAAGTASASNTLAPGASAKPPHSKNKSRIFTPASPAF